VTDKAKTPKSVEAEISEVLLTRSPSRFVGVLRLLRRLRSIGFHRWGLLDRRTWPEGVFSFKQRRCDETNQYHPTQQSPHENDWLPRNENPHGRTSGDEERLTITDYYTAKKPRPPFSSLSFLFLVLLASSGVRESTFQISRQIRVFCRDVNRYVQTSFAVRGICSILPERHT
jgi:hypothetical protein